MFGRRLLIGLAGGLALLALNGCNPATKDQLAKGRENLKQRQVACGTEPAVAGVPPVATVAGVAGVNSKPDKPDTVYLEDWILIKVCNFDTLREKAASAVPPKPVTLYVQGIDTEVPPAFVDYENGILTFELHRNAKNNDLWHGLLYAPLQNRTASMYVSVGVLGDKPLPPVKGAPTEVQLQKIYVDNLTWLWVLLLISVALGLVIVGSKSDLLRDGPTIGGTKQSFSLARTQMAWWFFLVLVGYVFIWLVTSDRDTIPVSLLGLVGISATTALAAVAVSNRGSDQTSARKKLLDDELVAITAATTEIDTQLTDPTLTNIYPTLKAKKAEMEMRRQNIYLERASLTTISPSINWWRDLITDDNGAFGLDRVQIFVWTLVLGLIFLYSVLWDLSMPEFNNTLLALMGISSGTYIGFKLPSKT
jgi:hypothetical protein